MRVRRLKSTRDKVVKITDWEGNNSGGGGLSTGIDEGAKKLELCDMKKDIKGVGQYKNIYKKTEF